MVDEWLKATWVDAKFGPIPPPTGKARFIMGWQENPEALAPGAWLRMMGGREYLASMCGPEDIVWVPLLQCVTNSPAWDVKARCADYAEHISLLRELAPRVRGILVGNMGPEFVAHQGRGDRFRVTDATDLIKALTEPVLTAGGRPWLGTVDWTLVMDCYLGCAVRETMLSVGATQLCYCGYCLSPGCWWDRGNHLYGGQVEYQRERSGCAPSDELCEYLRGAPVWTDTNGPSGLANGNAEELERMGFAGGVIDPLMP